MTGCSLLKWLWNTNVVVHVFFSATLSITSWESTFLRMTFGSHQHGGFPKLHTSLLVNSSVEKLPSLQQAVHLLLTRSLPSAWLPSSSAEPKGLRFPARPHNSDSTAALLIENKMTFSDVLKCIVENNTWISVSDEDPATPNQRKVSVIVLRLMPLALVL